MEVLHAAPSAATHSASCASRRPIVLLPPHMPEAHSVAAVHTAPIARLDAVATPVGIGGDGEYWYGGNDAPHK